MAGVLVGGVLQVGATPAAAGTYAVEQGTDSSGAALASPGWIGKTSVGESAGRSSVFIPPADSTPGGRRAEREEAKARFVIEPEGARALAELLLGNDHLAQHRVHHGCHGIA